ncbi:MAG: tyrosine-type recombinase/integrase [Herpetosiphonaceae bacterium]|nr:tyrosine-type recombinase/integrase [Herpetosiphonaceae bacterium]
MQRVIPLKTERQERSPEVLLEEWCRALQAQDRSTGTVKKYTQAISHFLAWYEQEEGVPLHLGSLTPMSLIGYRTYLQHDQQLARSTINLQVSALRSWCAWLLDAGYLPSDLAVRVKLIGGTAGSKREGLAKSHLNALLRQAQASRDGSRNYAIIQVLVQTGIRLGECSALTFGDVTFRERSGSLLIRAGKGNKVRTVPLNASAREALVTSISPRLAGVPATAKAMAAHWPKATSERRSEAVFLSQKGGALTSSAMGQVIAELVAAAGPLVPAGTSAHHLRHTFARSYLAQYPSDVVGLAMLLGHRSLETTRLYSEPAISQLATRLERLALNAYAE